MIGAIFSYVASDSIIYALRFMNCDDVHDLFLNTLWLQTCSCCVTN